MFIYGLPVEVLSMRGWVSLDKITTLDKIMAVDTKTKQIAYVSVLEMNKSIYSGDLIHFTNTGIDLLVHECHSMYNVNESGDITHVKRNGLSCNLSYTRQAKDTRGCGGIPYSGFVWKGNNTKEFILPEVSCVYNKQKVIYNSKEIDMLWWVRFLGIYLAEGGCRGTLNKDKLGYCQKSMKVRIHSYEINVKQKDKYYVDLIREVFEHLPFKYCERMGKNGITCFSITDRQLWDYLYRLGNSYEKYIPKDIKNLSTFYLNELMIYMMMGDGTKRKELVKSKLFDYRNINHYLNYQSFSENLKDDVQEVMLKLGKLSRKYKNYHYVSTPNTRQISYLRTKKNKEHYNGYVCSVKLLDGYIALTRNEGKVIFS